MEITKLHFVLIANLISFGLLLQLDEIRYYKPSGKKLHISPMTSHKNLMTSLGHLLPTCVTCFKFPVQKALK